MYKQQASISPAASAKCIRVFLSGLSSKFLQQTQRHRFVQRTLAYSSHASIPQNSYATVISDNPPHSIHSSSSNSQTVCSYNLLSRELSLYEMRLIWQTDYWYFIYYILVRTTEPDKNCVDNTPSCMYRVQYLVGSDKLNPIKGAGSTVLLM